MLVLITEVNDTEITAVPATVDPAVEDVQCIVLANTETVLGVEVTLWMDLRSSLPLRVLDEIVDELSPSVADTILASVSDPSRALHAGLRRGTATLTEFEHAATARAEIEDGLDQLQSSPALPVQEEEGQPTRTLASILGTNTDLRSMVNALRPFGFSQPEVMQLLHGKRPVPPEIVEPIAEVTGIDTGAIACAVQPLPVGFVREVDHPRWRRTWRERAQREAIDEAAARMKVSYEMFARAARQTGDQEPDWSARLAQYRSSQGERGRR
ncbi:hypothetical protein AAFP30_24620 [Gordonia sp. CPCC 205515]|uniref:hypothetical protein n=1 Tax=Gordonia sp. CPCC 205515 TaxID=3140791 RepID=UPI003AF3E736